MARYAILNTQGLVVNVIEWDGITPWSPPEGHVEVLDTNNSIEINHILSKEAINDLRSISS